MDTASEILMFAIIAVFAFASIALAGGIVHQLIVGSPAMGDLAIPVCLFCGSSAAFLWRIGS